MAKPEKPDKPEPARGGGKQFVQIQADLINVRHVRSVTHTIDATGHKLSIRLVGETTPAYNLTDSTEIQELLRQLRAL